MARDFSPRVHFQYRLFDDVCTSPCAIECIVNICAHDKDLVVYVRVRWSMETLKRWIMETLKHPAHAPEVGWRDSVAIGFPREKQPEFPTGEIPMG